MTSRVPNAERRPLPSLVVAGLGMLAAAAPALGQFGGPAAVRVDEVRREPVIERRMVTGDLRATRRAQVAAQEPGVVMEIAVREGQVVAKGEILAALDARRLQIMLRQIQADGLVSAAVHSERNKELEWKLRDLELISGSFDDGAANPRELQDATSAHAVAVARAAAAEQQVQLNAVRAELLEERLTDMSIKAPFAGIVVARHVEQGEWLAEGDAVVELVSTGDIEAWLNVPQQHIAAVRGPDVSVSTRLDATGRIEVIRNLRVVPRVAPKARSFTLIATMPNDEGLLLAGMSLTAWVPTGVAREQLTVANDAVLRNETGSYVYVVRGGDGEEPRVFPVPVEVVYPLVDRSVVLAPQLHPGARVVVEGNEMLYPSAIVAPIPSPGGKP